MLSWLPLCLAAVVGLILGGGFLRLWDAGHIADLRVQVADLKGKADNQIAVEAVAHQAANEAAAGAVAGLQPKYVTINKAVERETRTDTRYVDTGCRQSPAAWGLLGEAYKAAGITLSARDSVSTPASP